MIPTSLTPGATVSAQDRSEVIDLVNRLSMAFDVWDLDTILGLHSDDFTVRHAKGVATGLDQISSQSRAVCMITVVQRAVSARDRAVCSEARRRSDGGKRWQ